MLLYINYNLRFPVYFQKVFEKQNMYLIEGKNKILRLKKKCEIKK